MNDVGVRHGFRLEIQGLRAVAVLLVIVYHLYPNRVSGGYVGVDVFFVLSGYLITSHLLREARETSRIAFGRFWARRIRRLLPASLLVLAVATILTWLYIPRSQWEQTLHQIAASALYVENWALAAEAVDYSALGSAPTLVQHYWSLSVEEQFYLVWPLLVAVGLLLARRLRQLQVTTVLALVLCSVTLASFVYSMIATSDNQAHAYFVTPTRAWEFGAGALVALIGAPSWWTARGTTRAALGWAGIGAILWAGLVLDDSTAFPGWIAAVPVGGTVAVVLAGAGDTRFSPARPLSWRPATFVGDISYSMYLWHWPLIVVLPHVTGVDLRTGDKLGIFAVTVIVSWACTRWVEDPMRNGRLLSHRSWRAFAFGAVGMASVVAAASVMQFDLDRDTRLAEAATARAMERASAGITPCLGPAALDDDSCGPVWGDGDPPLDPAAVAKQALEPAHSECLSTFEPPLRTCQLGARVGVRRTVAVVGDSHATAMLSAFDELGKQRDWRVVTYTRASCPFTDARRVLPEEPEKYYTVCRRSNFDIERRILEDPEVDTVFVTAYSAAYGWDQAPGTRFEDPATDGFRSLWRRLTDAGKQVIVVRDVPVVKDRSDVPRCIEANPGNPMACAVPRAEGLVPDVEAEAVVGAPAGVRLVDLSDQFCDTEHCHVVVGDVIAYRDYSHLTREYATLLTPYLGRAIASVDEQLNR